MTHGRKDPLHTYRLVEERQAAGLDDLTPDEASCVVSFYGPLRNLEQWRWGPGLNGPVPSMDLFGKSIILLNCLVQSHLFIPYIYYFCK